jgi:hypothetical protein
VSLRCVKAHVNGMLIVKDSMASHLFTATFVIKIAMAPVPRLALVSPQFPDSAQ